MNPPPSEGAAQPSSSFEAYRADVHRLATTLSTAHLLLDGIDLEAIARALARADSVGWALDPTAYRAALDSGQLDAQRELVRWARDTRSSWARLHRLAAGLLLGALEVACRLVAVGLRLHDALIVGHRTRGVLDRHLNPRPGDLVVETSSLRGITSDRVGVFVRREGDRWVVIELVTGLERGWTNTRWVAIDWSPEG